jgi:hypothetical protein
MNTLIRKLNEIGQDYFNESIFKLRQKNITTWIIDGKNCAVNYYNNDAPVVKVLKWFDDFWLFLEIRFIKVNKNEYKKPKEKDKRDEFINLLKTQFIKFNDDFFQIFFSLSIFQGSIDNNNKIQLFRAEWDNWESLSDRHPQPHWHIYPTHKYVEGNYRELIKKYEKGEEDFNSFLQDKNFPEIINLKRFHFAMNGQWSENKPDVHKINVENDLLNWFSGVLNHIKKQLEYVKEK